MALLDRLKLILMIGDLLSQPGRICSVLHLARLVKTTDDKVRRYVKDWEEEFNTKILDIENGKVALTGTGHALYDIAQDLKRLADKAESTVEVLRIEADPLIAASLLLVALANFLSTYGSFIRVLLAPLDAPRENLRTGKTALGIGFVDDSEPVLPSELLEEKIPWILIANKPETFGAGQESISAEILSSDTRLIVPALAANTPGVAAFLAGFPEPNRLECMEVQMAWAMVAAGLGVAIVPALAPYGSPAGIVKSPPIAGVEPLQLRFYFPRIRQDRLPEHVQALVDDIRKAANARFSGMPEPYPATDNLVLIPEISNNHLAAQE